MPCKTRVATTADNRHAPTRQVRDAVLTSIREDRHAGAGAAREACRPSRAAAARQRRAALGKYAKTAAAAGQGVGDGSSRSQRYRARNWLSEVRTETSQKRWRDCGRASVTEGGEVQVRVSESGERRSAGVGGVATCGSVWACPVCSAKIAAQRTSEIEQALAWNAARGGAVALATFTMRHNRGHQLKTLRKALTAAWRHITEHRTWKKTRKELGCDAYIRAVECTHGDENGWHLHIHALLFFDGPISQELVDDWTDELYELWSDGLAMNNMEASREVGVDVRVGQGALDGLGKYLSKLTFEAAGGRFKKGRKGGRTPFEVLEDAINYGAADDFDIWFEWERGSKGLRQITWSQGFKKRVGLEEKKDEEIAEEDEGGDTLAHIAPSSWKWLYWHVGELLDLIEAEGSDAGLSWLDRHDVTFELGSNIECSSV